MTEPTDKMKAAYQRGQELANVDYNTIVYNDMIPQSYYNSNVLNLFFEAGKHGYEIPQYVTGWRYGSIPESGKSYNYRDQKPEPGVSLMGIDGQEIKVVDKISAMFIAVQDRPVVKVSGWLHFKTGSDGEPIIVKAEVIK